MMMISPEGEEEWMTEVKAEVAVAIVRMMMT